MVQVNPFNNYLYNKTRVPARKKVSDKVWDQVMKHVNVQIAHRIWGPIAVQVWVESYRQNIR